jgi:hypothetical protein
LALNENTERKNWFNNRKIALGELRNIEMRYNDRDVEGLMRMLLMGAKVAHPVKL